LSINTIKRQKLWPIFYHIIAWGIPILISIFVTIEAKETILVSREGFCALNPAYEMAFWTVPLVLSLLWNLIIYLIVFLQLRAALANFPTEKTLVWQMWRRLRYDVLL
jgi:hypothetical protein